MTNSIHFFPGDIPVKSVRDEVIATICNTTAEMADMLPENNFWGFYTYTMFLPEILKEIGHLSIPQHPVTGPLWNYVDAVSSMIVGANQLRDDQNHRPLPTKAKGVVNILSGAQVIILTGINFTLFGGPAFVAAFAAGFALSLDEVIRAGRRFNSQQYWLEDSFAQLAKLDELMGKLRLEINEMDTLMTHQNESRMANWALRKKRERLQEFEETKNEVLHDVLVRLTTLRYQHVSNPKLGYVEMIKNLVDSYEKIEVNTQIKPWLTRVREVLELEPDSLKDTCDTANHQQTEMIIQNKCKSHLKNSVMDSFIWGVAFTGCLMLCIPGLQLPGMVVMGVASALYVAKNSHKIISFFRNCAPLTPSATRDLNGFTPG